MNVKMHKGKPLISYAFAMGRVKANKWRLVEIVRCKGEYRLNCVTPKGTPRTIRCH